jgi:hypothetical protein
MLNIHEVYILRYRAGCVLVMLYSQLVYVPVLEGNKSQVSEKQLTRIGLGEQCSELFFSPIHGSPKSFEASSAFSGNVINYN